MQAGFYGSLEQWLLSLKGEHGEVGPRGETGSPGRDGSDGLSAYMLAQQNGFSGTMQEWLQSLIGAPGKDADPKELDAIKQQLALLPQYKEFQAAYVPRSHFVGTISNSALISIKFERSFSETPMVKVVLNIQDAQPRIIYAQNQTATGFQIATNYAASLVGVWYEASVLNTTV